MLYLNLNAAAYFAAPGGFPVRMSQMRETLATGFFPKKYSTVTVTASADSAATAHAAIAMPPILPGGDDLQIIAQTDQKLNAGQSTFTVSVPTTLPTVAQLAAGTIALSAGLKTVTGTGTAFATDGSWLGYQIHADGDLDANSNPLWYTIASVASSTSLTLTGNSTNTISAVWYVRPPAVNPIGFVFKLWVDGFVNTSANTISRQPGTSGYSQSAEPGMPQGVTIYSVQAS